jgi:hypothetical protein
MQRIPQSLLLALCLTSLGVAAWATAMNGLPSGGAVSGTDTIAVCQTATGCSSTTPLKRVPMSSVATFAIGTLPGTTIPYVDGTSSTQSGTTYSFAATDCGTEVIFTNNSAVTATIPASIAPAAGTTCNIAVLQDGTAKVSVNGAAVTAATLVSAHSYTGTGGAAGSIISLNVTTIGSTATAILTGDGS